MRTDLRALLCGLVAVVLTGCRGTQSALDPAGHQAARIDHLWWLMFWVSTAVFGLVILFLCIAVVRRASGEDKQPPPRPVQRRLTAVVSGAVVVTVIILFIFLTDSFLTGRTLSSIEAPNARIITITGHQWWWKVRYEDPIASNIVVTANEIHIPVGEPVQFKLKSSDVIHSFWIPNLHGKRDLIPGRTTTLWIRADRPGAFDGQCAEFCGMQHARMRFRVIAQEPQEFQLWLEHQRAPARTPSTPSEQRGQKVFLSNTCIMCHTIRGTRAVASVAPDLTHLASRQTIAANTLRNTRGHLGGWVLDPQRIKPGNRMPPNDIAPEDLHPLLDYLMSLE